MEFLSLKPQAFGLDISDLSLKIIKLKKRRGDLVLASIGEGKIKPGIIEGGEIKNEEKLAETIKTVCEKVRGEELKTKYVSARRKIFFGSYSNASSARGKFKIGNYL